MQRRKALVARCEWYSAVSKSLFSDASSHSSSMKPVAYWQ